MKIIVLWYTEWSVHGVRLFVRCHRPYNSSMIPQEPRSVKFSLHRSKLCRASPASLTNETCQGVGPACFPRPLYSNRRGENVLGGFYEGGSHNQRPEGWAGFNQLLSSYYAGNLKTKGVNGAARAQCETKVESSLQKGCAGAQGLKSRAEDRWGKGHYRLRHLASPHVSFKTRFSVDKARLSKTAGMGKQVRIYKHFAAGPLNYFLALSEPRENSKV